MINLRVYMGICCGIAAAALISGCSSAPAKLTNTPEFAPVYPTSASSQQPGTGAIFTGRQGDNWFGRGVTYQVGDIVTVLLNESTQAQRRQSTNVSRESANDVFTPALVNKLSSSLVSSLKTDGATIESEGIGETGQRASLTGAITATVVEVLANGNLVIRGEKQLALSEGGETIQVSGIVRPTDISPNNTVQSRRLANAQIAYRGTGDLANAAKPGWGTSVLMRFWPF